MQTTALHPAPALAERAPELCLIDARAEQLDARELRARAREAAAAAAARGARFSSRSYCYPLALVAWHEAPVGIDVERVVECDRAFADSIRTPAERALATEPPLEEWDRHFTSLWCAKEALAKALGDARAYDPHRLDAPSAWPEGRSGSWRARALELDGDHVAWLCWQWAAP